MPDGAHAWYTWASITPSRSPGRPGRPLFVSGSGAIAAHFFGSPPRPMSKTGRLVDGSGAVAAARASETCAHVSL